MESWLSHWLKEPVVQSPNACRLLLASLRDCYWAQYCFMSFTDNLDDVMGRNHSKFEDNAKLGVND